MQGLVDDAPVLYVGSFSKTMFPALRIGFVVLPRAIAGRTAVALQEMLRGGHRLEQLALARFIESGEFGRHLGRMRRLYRERQQALREARAEGLNPRALSSFALHPDPATNGLVIGYGNTAAEQLAPAVHTLAALARDMSGKEARSQSASKIRTRRLR